MLALLGGLTYFIGGLWKLGYGKPGCPSLPWVRLDQPGCLSCENVKIRIFLHPSLRSMHDVGLAA